MSRTAAVWRHEYGPDEGPPLVLLHGLTEAGTAWPDAVSRWQDRWHVVAVDLRGHGRSPRFTGDEVGRSYQVWLDDVLAVLASLPEPATLVGHSLGGLFALRAAVTDPDRVRALVLEDPARPDGGTAPEREFVRHQEEFLDTFADGGTAEKARMRRDSTWTPAEIDAWADCKPLVDRRMIREGLVLGPADWPDACAALRAPTLLVVPLGGEMAAADDEVANPLVTIARIPGVGHCVRRDDPAAYHAVVDSFLDRQRRSTPG